MPSCLFAASPLTTMSDAGVTQLHRTMIHSLRGSSEGASYVASEGRIRDALLGSKRLLVSYITRLSVSPRVCAVSGGCPWIQGHALGYIGGVARNFLV
jgi:hypothetical protein